jgi:hypothetical protein
MWTACAGKAAQNAVSKSLSIALLEKTAGQERVSGG